MMHNIPVTIVDDFFDHPDLWRKLADNCEYFPAKNGTWPGVRSNPIQSISPDAFDVLCQKFFAIFYDGTLEQIGWSVDARFQKVSAKDGEGWVHQDQCKVSGIVYLSPDPDPRAGTSVYEPAEICTIKHQDVKSNLFKGNVDLKFAEPYRNINNNQYIETINVSNKYNRLVAFDGHLPHKANIYDANAGERLTLVFFVNNISAPYTPIGRLRRT